MTAPARQRLEAIQRRINEHIRYLKGLDKSGDCGHWLTQHVINFQSDVDAVESLAADLVETPPDRVYAQASALVDAALPEYLDLVALVRAAQPFVQEVWDSHRDPENNDYNECEKAPCVWCEGVAALLAYPLARDTAPPAEPCLCTHHPDGGFGADDMHDCEEYGSSCVRRRRQT